MESGLGGGLADQGICLKEAESVTTVFGETTKHTRRVCSKETKKRLSNKNGFKEILEPRSMIAQKRNNHLESELLYKEETKSGLSLKTDESLKKEASRERATEQTAAWKRYKSTYWGAAEESKKESRGFPIEAQKNRNGRERV